MPYWSLLLKLSHQIKFADDLGRGGNNKRPYKYQLYSYLLEIILSIKPFLLARGNDIAAYRDYSSAKPRSYSSSITIRGNDKVFANHITF